MNKDILTGIVIDERVQLTTRDLCRACGSSTEWVIELVHEGVLTIESRTDEGRNVEGQDVEGGTVGGEITETWRFSGPTLERAIRARRLQRDLDLNLPGVALVLELMDEIESLRQRLRRDL